jgi:hypothetical protein
VSGAEAYWGGCDVWLSDDNLSYKNIGRIYGPCRTGLLTVALATGSSPDVTNILKVSLTESKGELNSGTQADADYLNTLCYVDGEFLAYQAATLTGADQYDLSYLVRGAYGSAIGAHASGAQFARIDDNIFKYPYRTEDIGKTLHLKFTSFNVWSFAVQGLDEVSGKTYLIAPGAPKQITSTTAASAVKGFKLSLLAYVKPVDFKQFEVYISTTAGVSPTGWDGTKWVSQPNTPAGWNGTDKTLFMITTTDPIQVTGLTPGVTYHYKVVVVDKSSMRSIPSPEGTAVAGDAQRSSTLVVAASDASAASKAGADYVCDGVDDQDTINEAINTLPEKTFDTGTAQGGTTSTVVLAADAETGDNYYTGCTIEILSGAGIGQSSLIYDYTGLTKTVNLYSTWETPPDSTSVYKIYSKVGTITLTEGRFYVGSHIAIKYHNINLIANSSSTIIIPANNFTISASDDGVIYISGSYCMVSGFAIKNINNVSTYSGILDMGVANTINNINMDGILQYSIICYRGSHSTISNCYINNSGNVCISCAKYITVYKNNIQNSLNDGIGLYGAEYCKISLNNIENSVNNGIYMDDYTLIPIGGYICKNNQIFNNNLVQNGIGGDNTYSQIYAYNDWYSNINFNIIRKGESGNYPAYGIRIGTSSGGELITNNDCYTGGTTAGIYNQGININFGSGNRNNDGTWSATPS